MSAPKLSKFNSKSMIINEILALSHPMRTNSEYKIIDNNKFESSPKESKAKEHFVQLRKKMALLQNKLPQTPVIRRKSEAKTFSAEYEQFPKNADIQDHREYRLNVSSTSSDSSSNDSFSKGVQTMKNISDNATALENFRKLRTENSYKEAINQKSNSNLSCLEEKINVNFLRSLHQNNESKEFDEFYDNGFLNIQMQSNDVLQFIRYQNESQELIRRQQEFFKNRGLHTELESEELKYQAMVQQKRLRKEDEQKKTIQKILQRENRNRHSYQRQKTSRVGNIAQKFIEENHKVHELGTYNDTLHLLHQKRDS